MKPVGFGNCTQQMSLCCRWSFIPNTGQEVRSSRWLALQVCRRSLTITKSRRGRGLLCLCVALEKYVPPLASGKLIFQDGCVIFRSLLAYILRFIFFSHVFWLVRNGKLQKYAHCPTTCNCWRIAERIFTNLDIAKFYWTLFVPSTHEPRKIFIEALSVSNRGSKKK
jgi:hypothetical protein